MTSSNKVLQSDFGTFMSPYFPQTYPSLANCFWTIRTNQGTRPQLTFTDFDFEDKIGDICNDYLHLYDGKDARTRMIGEFCGRQKPPTTESSRNDLTIHMVTNDQIEKKGFSARWETLCGQNPRGEKLGTIQNRRYGLGTYLKNQDCVWNISASNPQDLIEIKFKDLDIEQRKGFK